MNYIAYKQSSVFLYTKHFESVMSEMAAAIGSFLKAKMWRYKVKFVNEKNVLYRNYVYFLIILKGKNKK